MSLPALQASTTTRLCQWTGTAATMQSMSLRSRSSLYWRVVGNLEFPVISFASVWRPSYKSAAATHSTPGIVMAIVSRPEPCMPTPIMPKRTRSLGATARRSMGCASRKTVFEAIRPPAAAAAPPCKNARREKMRFMPMPPNELTAKLLFRMQLFLEGLDGDFFEENDVVVAVVLQPNPAEIWPRTALRLEVKFARRHRIAVFVVGHLHAIENDDRARAVEGNVHRVPLGPRFPGMFHQRLGQRVEHGGLVILILA